MRALLVGTVVRGIRGELSELVLVPSLLCGFQLHLPHWVCARTPLCSFCDISRSEHELSELSDASVTRTIFILMVFFSPDLKTPLLNAASSGVSLLHKAVFKP